MEYPRIAIDDRLLVFGGPYSNLQATEALFAEVDRLGLASDEVLCTGDLVAYCGDPQATIDLIRRRRIPVVRGNCEESLAADDVDCGCGFEEGSACDVLSNQWYTYSRSRVSEDAKRWMGELPRRIEISIAGRRMMAIHGGVDVANEFIFPSSDRDDKLRQLAVAGGDGIVAGHSGIPFIQLHGDRLWLNAGAIGMPANDGTPRAWYALLEARDGGVDVSIRSLRYDHAAAADAMRANGLDNGYADCLCSGLWPSTDVLPREERRATGTPLTESRVVWPLADTRAESV